MSSPAVSRVEQINHLSAQIEQVERKAFAYLCVVSSIDSEIRQTIELTSDIAQSQLEIIRDLSAQQPPRNFAAVPQQYEGKMATIREQYLENYRNLLNARDAIVERGAHVPLDAAKKAELRTRFTQELNDKLAEGTADFRVDEATDLGLMERQLEEKMHIASEVHAQALDQKTAAAVKMMDIKESTEFKRLLADRQILHSDPLIQDIWTAATLGSVEYLEGAVKNHSWFKSKTWLHTDRTFLEDKDSQGNTPLHLASQAGHSDVVLYLLSKDVRTSIVNSEGYQPLHLAAKYGHKQVVDALLEHDGASIDAKGAYGRTPLHMAAFNSRLQTAGLLLEKGANSNVQTTAEDHSKTPLHDAVIHGDKLMVAQLAKDEKLNVHIKDSRGHTPLYHAVSDGQLEIAVLLAGHESWLKEPMPANDPNSVTRLLTLVPRHNAEAIRNFLQGLPR